MDHKGSDSLHFYPPFILFPGYYKLSSNTLDSFALTGLLCLAIIAEDATMSTAP